MSNNTQLGLFGNRVTVDSSGNVTLSNNITASSIIKTGGTSAQFLKADGTVDTSVYVTTATGVTGPASSTDTALAIYNGVTGKIIKNSNLTN